MPAFAVTRDGDDSDETLRGTARSDLLVGRGGDDRIFGYGGDDRLYGGQGNDFLRGGPGKDRMDGGAGNDRIEARDGQRDVVICGAGRDEVVSDQKDVIRGDCERVNGKPAAAAGNGGDSEAPGSTVGAPPANAETEDVVLEDSAWTCSGPVDIDLVKVTMRTPVDDAVRIYENCSGRIGRIEVETWTADGIKVANNGNVAHDLVIESGYVKCHDVYGDYHQDGIQVMGGYRITFRNLKVDCLGNANLFVSFGGLRASTPTDVVCERCVFGPNSAQTLFIAPSIRSGARNTTICTGRYRALRIHPDAEAIVNVRNRVLPQGHPSCANVTGAK